jgi:anti-sigma B factor antagonist
MNVERVNEEQGVRLLVTGELDAISAPLLRCVFDALAAQEPARVVLDLSALELIDSSGVGAIVALFKQLRSTGGELGVVGLRGQPQSIFRLLRLDRVFGIE